MTNEIGFFKLTSSTCIIATCSWTKCSFTSSEETKVTSYPAITVLIVLGKTEAASKPANQDLIIINKYYNKLAYFHNGYIEIVDPIATGKTWYKTPVGFFKVVNKIKNRPHYTGHIPGGDPRNPLGKCWLGINRTQINDKNDRVYYKKNP